MEGEFIKIAKVILNVAQEGGLRPEEVAEIIGNTVGYYGDHKINCYPGKPSNECYPLAVFVSLHGKLARGRRWSDYNFEKILEKIIQHMQGVPCLNRTRHIVLITDSWWASSFEKWQGNIETIIRSGVYIEIYLIACPDSINQIKI